ncbi:MAG: hypothetical protein KAW12_26030 [Candidatus Aminicenantes bacterium]|nr:hypothetical protein [Candidatus Aminicenantes bacterium]
MPVIHVKTNDEVMPRILGFIDTLSREGADIEILDNKIYAYEKKQIDRSLQDIENGKIYTIDEVERELVGAS